MTSQLLVEFGDKMGDFCGDERILAENRRLNVAWVSTQLRLYWRKEGVYAVYASYTRLATPYSSQSPITATGEIGGRQLGIASTIAKAQKRAKMSEFSLEISYWSQIMSGNQVQLGHLDPDFGP